MAEARVDAVAQFLAHSPMYRWALREETQEKWRRQARALLHLVDSYGRPVA